MWNKYLKKLNLPESYISITLGFLVIIVAGLLLYNNIGKKSVTPQTNQPDKLEEEQQEISEVLPLTHKVSQGETLWSIAESYYKSGYNWVTIAKENNLSNPDKIYIGQDLNIPKAETITPVSEKILTGEAAPTKTYTVVRGDNLWNIAVSQYGDGFAWTKIANENMLVNPNLIHAGNVLKLP